MKSNKATVEYIQSVTGLTKSEIKAVLHALAHFLSDTLVSGEQVELYHFGRFATRPRKARVLKYAGCHPQWGAYSRTIVQPASRTIKFTPTMRLRKKLYDKPINLPAV